MAFHERLKVLFQLVDGHALLLSVDALACLILMKLGKQCLKVRQRLLLARRVSCKAGQEGVKPFINLN